MNDFWSFLPDFTSPLGLALLAAVSYIVSYLFALLVSPKMEQVTNIEERVKKEIIRRREEKLRQGLPFK